MTNAGLQESGFPLDEAKESHVIIAIERGVDLHRRLDDLGASHFRSQVLDDPERVAVIEIEKDDVGSELRFIRTEDVLQG